VAAVLTEHLEQFPPVKVTLPWGRPDGDPVTKELVFTRERGTAVRGTGGTAFNNHDWKPALAAVGVIPAPIKSGDRFRYLAAREHGMHSLRHFYASVLLDAGENIKALSQYLGHADPGFTLRVYTHLMLNSEGRALLRSPFRVIIEMSPPTTLVAGEVQPMV
jgi:integrase